jgi:hypothetical protein
MVTENDYMLALMRWADEVLLLLNDMNEFDVDQLTDREWQTFRESAGDLLQEYEGL